MARSYHLGLARRLVNSIASTLIGLGLAPRSWSLLTTTGRRTGRRRTTPVILLRHGGYRWLVSPYGMVSWVRNVRADPVVLVRRGRLTEQLRATEVDGPAAAPVLRSYLSQARSTRPFFDVDARDPLERFVGEAARHPVFRLDPF